MKWNKSVNKKKKNKSFKFIVNIVCRDCRSTTNRCSDRVMNIFFILIPTFLFLCLSRLKVINSKIVNSFFSFFNRSIISLTTYTHRQFFLHVMLKIVYFYLQVINDYERKIDEQKPSILFMVCPVRKRRLNRPPLQA